MRLFVALYPPESALQDLPVRTGREHVTLAFLGELPGPDALLEPLSAVAALPAPLVRLGGAGRFAGGAVWLAVHGDLRALHDEVLRALAAAGLGAAGPWHPHLTVGRGQVPPWAAAYEGPELPWERVALVSSRPAGGVLRGRGVRHDVVREWRLGGPGGAGVGG